jgi:uncharacterized protein
MRIVIASDIHGRVTPARKLSELISSYSPDRVLLLGDYLYGGPNAISAPDYDPYQVARILNKHARRIIGIRGDCDCRADQKALLFPIGEECRVLEIDGYRVDMIHGDLLTGDILTVERGDILLFGHTHVPVLKKEDGVVYFNPGSVSLPKNGFPTSFALFERGKIEIKRLDDKATFLELDLL